MYEQLFKSVLSQSVYLAIALLVAKRYENHLIKSLDKRDIAFEKLAEKYDIVVSIKENTDKIPYIEEDVKELKYNKIGGVRNAQ